MNNIFTNTIEVNSFMGLVSDNQKKSRPAIFRRQSYAKVENKPNHNGEWPTLQKGHRSLLAECFETADLSHSDHNR